LRFYRSCGWFLWVFKFFFGFLSSRRSAWNNALHSFHTALGKIETPFFGASRKRRLEKKAGKSAVLRGVDCGLRFVEWWTPRRCRALGFASRCVVLTLVSAKVDAAEGGWSRRRGGRKGRRA